MTPREAFLALLYTGPLLHADAVVILSGDGVVRLDVALGALRQRAAHYAVVSGGVDNPPHSLNADDAAKYLIGHGLAPDRIIREGSSQNTHEQAEWLASECAAQDWTMVLLATSAYHAPRAFLTVLASLQAADLDETVCVIPLVASQVPWWGKPEGQDCTRINLLEGELAKIEMYRENGHVVSYEDGVEYLRHWEQGPR